MRTIRVCSGIGDNLWLFQKLINTGEKFNFQIAGCNPKRSIDIFKMLPDLCNDARYKNFNTADVLKNTIQKKHALWKNIKDQEFYLAANEYLEKGNRIEGFFPDLKTSFTFNFDTKKHVKEVDNYLNENYDYIGIYTASYPASRNWGFWDEHKWADLILYLNKKNTCFVIIGADFDSDICFNLCELLKYYGINHVKIIGKKLGAAVEVLRRLKYFIGFPSGLPILSTMLKKPTLMFYPARLKNLMYTWAEKKLTAKEIYKPMLFCEPEDVFKWLKNKL